VCQEPTTVFLLFDEPVADCWNDVEVEVVIDDVQSSEFCVKTVADWMNPYTYTFIAPGTHVDLAVAKCCVKLESHHLRSHRPI